MAPWGDGKLLFCILFLTCCIATLAQIPVDCCIDIRNTEYDKRSIVDYRRQVKGQGCSVDAVIVLTRRGKTLCVTPDMPWLSGMMKHVDELKKFCKRHNYERPRCYGMKP